MNRYWDLSERKRSELTSEQVEAMLSVELMEKGVVRVEAPKLEEVTDVQVAGTQYYEVEFGAGSYKESTKFCFATMDQARAFVDACPIEIESDYSTDYKNYAKPCRGLGIKIVNLPDEAAFINAKAALVKQAETKKANKVLTDAYQVDLNKVREASNGVWEDWRQCQYDARQYQKVLDTKKEYDELCKGDENLSRKFLAKAFDKETIEAAEKWFGVELLPDGTIEAVAKCVPVNAAEPCEAF